MKSSDRPALAPGERKAQLIALVVLVLSVAAVSMLRVRLIEHYGRKAVQSDLYALPAPDHLVVASLGYRAALADILYANTLVWYGLHIQEKRRFEYVGNYLDAITTLDPTFRPPYLYADTLLVMQAIPARYADYVKARELLERGMRAFPHDGELWLNAGQFLAYLAAPTFENPKLKEEWRLDGARVLAKTCELVGGNETIPYHCITAAGLFSKTGEREATVRFLERMLTVNDNPEIRELALRYLEKTEGSTRRDQLKNRRKRFHDAWGADLRFIGRDLLMLVGPRFDSAHCSGLGAANSPDCATTWRAWAEHLPED